MNEMRSNRNDNNNKHHDMMIWGRLCSITLSLRSLLVFFHSICQREMPIIYNWSQMGICFSEENEHLHRYGIWTYVMCTECWVRECVECPNSHYESHHVVCTRYRKIEPFENVLYLTANFSENFWSCFWLVSIRLAATTQPSFLESAWFFVSFFLSWQICALRR